MARVQKKVNAKSANQGFTLIELMIVIAIFVILASIGMTGLGAWNENTRIRNIAQSVTNGLQQARVLALQNNAAVRFTLAGNSWTMGCVTATASCPATVDQFTADASSSNITAATTPVANTTVTYSPLGVINNPAASFNTVDVTSTVAGTRSLRVQVASGGSARLCDPSVLVAASPRGC